MTTAKSPHRHAIDEEVNCMAMRAYDQAFTLFTNHRETLDRIGLHETLDARQLNTIIEGAGSNPSRAASYRQQ